MNPENEDEFNFFEPDLNRLEEEWVRQPKYYFLYAEKLANARSRFDQAKATRDIVVSEADRDIRKSPAVYGIEKITEDVVKRATVLVAKVQEAEREVLRRKHRMDVLQAVVDALDHRKTSLSKLVDLWLANYFATPASKTASRERLQQAETDAAFGKRLDR